MKCRFCGNAFPSRYWFVDEEAFAGLPVCKSCFAKRAEIADFDSRIQALQRANRARRQSRSPGRSASSAPAGFVSAVRSAVRSLIPAATVLVPVGIVYAAFAAGFLYVLVFGFGSAIGHTGSDWPARARFGVVSILVIGAVLATLVGLSLEKVTFAPLAGKLAPWWTRARSRVVTVLIALAPLILLLRLWSRVIASL